MFRFLIQCIKNFGMAGLLVYLKIKLNRTQRISLPGYKFPLTMRPQRTDKITFREIFFRKEYDIQLPPGLDPSVIIDAGANIGFTSLFFINRFPQAKIFSIEPNEENFNLLQANVKQYSTIIPIKSAVWHTREMIEVVDRGYGERGFVVEKSADPNSLQAISIDNLMDDYNLQHIDILKIDIEGSEKEVFSLNYEKWLPVTKVLIIELHDRMKPGSSQAVFKAINRYDFSMSIKGENLVFINNRLV